MRAPRCGVSAVLAAHLGGPRGALLGALRTALRMALPAALLLPATGALAAQALHVGAGEAPRVAGPAALVIPPEAAGAEGNAAARDPFGFDRRRHVQYVHRDLLRPLGAGAALRALAYRRDAAGGAAMLRRERPGEAKQQPLWLVRLGDVHVDVGDPPSRYPALADPRWQMVFGPRRVDFPDLAQPSPAVGAAASATAAATATATAPAGAAAAAAGPAPFELVFPFDRPFRYAGGELGIEHVVHHRRTVSYDYVVDAVEVGGAAGVVHALGSPASAQASDGARLGGWVGPPGGTFGLILRDAPPHAAVALLLGGAGARCWSGDPLAAAPQAVPLATDADGRARFTHRLPRSAAWNGMPLRARVRLDGTAAGPELGLRCGALLAPSAAMLATVSGFPDTQVEHGFVQPGRGLVLELRQ